MPQLRQYPQTTVVQATDGFWLDRVGVGTEWIEWTNLLAAPFAEIANLPAAAALTGTEPTVVLQSGIPVQTPTQDIANLAPAAPTVNVFTYTEVSSSVAMAGSARYSVKTGSGAYAPTLPTVASVLSTGKSIQVVDGDNNASVNNITITPNGADVIDYYGSSGTTLVLDVNGAAVTLIPVAAGHWRALPL